MHLHDKRESRFERVNCYFDSSEFRGLNSGFMGEMDAARESCAFPSMKAAKWRCQ